MREFEQAFLLARAETKRHLKDQARSLQGAFQETVHTLRGLHPFLNELEESADSMGPVPGPGISIDDPYTPAINKGCEDLLMDDMVEFMIWCQQNDCKGCGRVEGYIDEFCQIGCNCYDCLVGPSTGSGGGEDEPSDPDDDPDGPIDDPPEDPPEDPPIG